MRLSYQTNNNPQIWFEQILKKKQLDIIQTEKIKYQAGTFLSRCKQLRLFQFVSSYISFNMQAATFVLRCKQLVSRSKQLHLF
jgi:hypothetical protein